MLTDAASVGRVDDLRRPLVVDLDGTLLHTDLLVESVWGMLGERPLHVLSLIARLWRGRAFLKRSIAARVEIDVRSLPYNEEVLARIREASRIGRPVFLASASDTKYVSAVAQHLRLFAGWFGSDGTVNLKGRTKARRLVEAFGERGFDYVGNDEADIPVWEHAHTPLAVARSSSRLMRKLKALGRRVELVPARKSDTASWLRLLRPHQWAKNLLLAVAALTAHAFTPHAFRAVALAVAAFSLCASSVYVLNDLLDVRSDRAHPTKRQRPFAAGDVPLLYGALVAPLLLAASLALGLAVSARFAAVLGAYYLTTLAYSFVLKRKMIIDVVTLAGLYTIRIVAGAVAIDVTVSHWILAFSMFIFLSLALVKRYSELATRSDAGLPDVKNRNYKAGDLPVVLSLAAAAAYSAVIVFSLYLSSDTVARLYRSPLILWLAVPLLIYWISRMIMMAHRRLLHEDPIVFALRDPVSLCTGMLLLLLLLAASYVGLPPG